MTRATDPFPPLDPGQTATATFDMANILGPALTLTGMPTISVTIAPGSLAIDPDPQAIVLSAPTIAPSPGSGLPGQAVLCRIGNLVDNVTYNVQCLCNASNGDKVSLYAPWTAGSLIS